MTIRDVADKAGVSVSTASRILSNSTKEKYAESTRKKVLQASEALGYRANFAARALVSGKTHIIAAIFPHNYGRPFAALASLQILSGIESFCSDNGYHMLLTSPREIDGALDANFTTLVLSGYLDGVIILGYFNITTIMGFLSKVDIPSVVLGHYDHPYYLRADDVEGGRLIMEHLIQLGHRRIAIIGANEIPQRLKGVRLSAQVHGIDITKFPSVIGDFSEESGAQAAEKLLCDYPDLTALIAFNDRMAMGAIKRLQEMGYRVPEQISVIGYDDLPRSNDFNPPLTTINHRLSEWGGLAMDMLLKLMNGDNPDPIILSPHLVVRQSTAVPYAP